MAASNGDVPARENRTRNAGGSVSRYDLLLFLIPAAFVVALLGSAVAPVSTTTLLAAASVVGALALADGLFVNPPEGPGGR